MSMSMVISPLTTRACIHRLMAQTRSRYPGACGLVAAADDVQASASPLCYRQRLQLLHSGLPCCSLAQDRTRTRQMLPRRQISRDRLCWRHATRGDDTKVKMRTRTRTRARMKIKMNTVMGRSTVLTIGPKAASGRGTRRWLVLQVGTPTNQDGLFLRRWRWRLRWR